MARYCFGPFELDPEERLLRREGEALPLAGKTLDALVLLVENRGRLVDKEELLSKVWAGSVVEEANLTQAIFTVRKTLGDSPKDHRYIATVAGRGYQFVAPVTEPTASTQAPDKEIEAPYKQPRTVWFHNRMLPFGAAGFLLVVIVAGLALWSAGHPEREQIPEPIPFTSRAGFAEYPAFSPDGKQIAYSWSPEPDAGASLYVKLVGSDTEIQITNSPGSDRVPAWSPDGRQIAFCRSLPGHSGYYLVSALGGPVRQLLLVDTGEHPCGVDWFPDGKHLALVVPTERLKNPGVSPEWNQWQPHRIVSFNIETGEETPLTTPAKNVIWDHLPTVSPNGQMLAFVRSPTPDTGDIYLLPLERGAQPRRLTNLGAIYDGMAWTRDSRELIFAMFQNGRSRIWRLPISSGGTSHPITSSVETVFAPTLARQANRLAYVVSSGHRSLWRMEISGSGPRRANTPERFLYSTRDDSQPVYSPDGSKIAFASNRAGPLEIWVAGADGSSPVQLTNCGGPNNGTPRWSPDGSAIAFDSRIQGNPEILVVSVEGHTIRQITHHPAEDVVPSWSRDGRWIYFASNRNGDLQIYKVSSVTGESPSSSPVQVTTGGGLDGVESPDGQYLYFAKGRGRRGLWRRRLVGPGQGSEEPVLESLQYWGWWALGPDGIFFLELGNETPHRKVHLKFLELPSRRVTELRTLEYPVIPFEKPITVSPDGRQIVYEQIENAGSNIVLLENFRQKT